MQEIKVGDRVKVVKTRGFYSRMAGRTGTVHRLSSGDGVADVVFDDGAEDYGYTSDLELVATPAPPAPTIPDEIEINGAKYRRVIEEATPEKPEPKAGQVWRDTSDGSLLMVTDESDETGRKSIVIGGMRRGYALIVYGRLENPYFDNCRFIAPSLADALERGLITAADLK